MPAGGHSFGGGKKDPEDTLGGDNHYEGLKARDFDLCFKGGIPMPAVVNEDLIVRVLAHLAKWGKLTSTRAQKLLYLVERECVLETGERCLNLEYRNWDHGMHSPALSGIIEGLKGKAGFEVEQIESKRGPGQIINFHGNLEDVALPRYLYGITRKVQNTYGYRRTPLLIRRAKGTAPFAHSKDREWLEWRTVLEDRLDRVISESRSILELKDNWDGEGAQKVSKETWERAVAFLKAESSEYRELQGYPMTVPDINPTRDGSIDLVWQTNDWRLLINIPADASERAESYGHLRHERGQHTFKKDLSPPKPDRGLVQWMATVEGLGSKGHESRPGM